MTACAAREAAVKGEGGGHQLLPATSVSRHKLPAPGCFCGGRAGGRKAPALDVASGVTLESTQPMLLATGIPLLFTTSIPFVPHSPHGYGVKRAVGVLEPLCVLALWDAQ